MTVKAKQRVCIRCKNPGNVERLGIMEDEQREVGVVYCCRGCLGSMSKYTLEIFLSPDEERSQHPLH